MIHFHLIITRFILFRLDKSWAKYKDLPLSDFSTTTTVASEAASTLKQKKASELNEYLSDVYTVKKRARLTDELEDYLSEPREPSDESYDNLLYWKQHTTCYPRLSRMARDYLAITATSASSERVFSVGRDLLGICRFCLKPTTMEACMCLRSWWRAGISLNDGKNTDDYTRELAAFLATASTQRSTESIPEPTPSCSGASSSANVQQRQPVEDDEEDEEDMEDGRYNTQDFEFADSFMNNRY